MSDLSGSIRPRNPAVLRLLAEVAAAGALGRLGVLMWRSRRVVVHGSSMVPTLLPGDRLLVLPARRLRVGDVVAVPDPRQPSRLLVKRVVTLGHGKTTLTVAGDNSEASSDSGTFGPVARDSVAGRAVYRYAPPERVGRIRRP